MIEYAYRYGIIPGFESLLKGRSTFRFLNDLDRSQWWSRREIRRWQLTRLRRLVKICFKHSAYYRETWLAAGLTPQSLQSLDDFQDWPLTSRETIWAQSTKIRSSDASLAIVKKSTGGSSGTPLRFVIDHSAEDRRVAMAMRGYGWAGAGPGTRQSYLWGVNLSDTSRRNRLKDFLYSRVLYRRDMLNSFQLSDRTALSFVRRLNRYQPRVVVAYTNPLFVLARIIDEHGLKVHRPKSIVVGAEKIHDFQRSLIENVFSAPVFETYGSREFTMIGAECEQHNGLHLSEENLIVEIVDDEGNRVSPGTEGQIVVTDLFNVAMPFVRYPIGDRGIMASTSCRCGRGLQLLGKVVGRQLDVIETPDGRQLPGEFFPHLLKDFSEVRQFQVIQSDIGSVELKLVVDNRWRDTTRDAISRRVQDALGMHTRLCMREVDQIPLTAAGKLQVVRGLRSRNKLSA